MVSFTLAPEAKPVPESFLMKTLLLPLLALVGVMEVTVGGAAALAVMEMPCSTISAMPNRRSIAIVIEQKGSDRVIPDFPMLPPTVSRLQPDQAD
jgi:hypothetical protein